VLLPDPVGGTGRRRPGARPSPRLTAIFFVSLAFLLAACGDEFLDDSLTDLETGDCIESPGSSIEVDSVDQVDCGPGALRVIERFELEGEEYPGDAALQEMIAAGCPIETVYTLGPTQDSWEKVDDRLVVCFVGVD
jgi:hypothetical protein